MSTFGGKLEEIENISIDRFDGDNLRSDAFFLSHCHTDHMVGLGNNEFSRSLRLENKFLYLSPVSAAIITLKYPNLKNNLQILDYDSPVTVLLPDKCISVLSIPAGHCPGSVMFLFEIKGKYILYTGDFRINPKELSKFKQFYFSHDQIKKEISKVYLDTTFFFKSYLRFPCREDSISELCNIMKPWISKGKNYIIDLKTSAKYGYEYLFREIYRNLNMPVHVDAVSYDLYKLVPELDNAITMDANKTQIHSHCLFFKTICKNSEQYSIKVVTVSAFRWHNEKLETSISEQTESGRDFVCYSTHASYEETVGFLKFLKPKEIFPCVLQKNGKDQYELDNSLEEILAEINESEECNEDETNKNSDEKLFTVEEKKSEEESETYSHSFLDSPPRKLAKI